MFLFILCMYERIKIAVAVIKVINNEFYQSFMIKLYNTVNLLEIKIKIQFRFFTDQINLKKPTNS